jgi:hypothetical protein
MAAALAAASFLFDKGVFAAALAAPWFLFTCALVFLLQKSWQERCHLSRQAVWGFRFALLYLPIGGTWLVISRSGFEPLGFAEPIILLTAVHFHFAGFVGPILTGLAKPPRWIQVGVIACPSLLAVGITLSPAIELVAALGLALSLGLTGLWQLRERSFLLRISSVSAMAGMVFAGLYAFRLVEIPTMAAWHGTTMALGFGVCGLLGRLRNAE